VGISKRHFDVIDREIFMSLHNNIENDMIKLKRLIYQCTGIPVSICIAPTKVLAKISNHIGKK